MVTVCSVCILRVKFKIDLSVSEMRRLCWTKFINSNTQREREREKESGWVGQSSLKELWKLYVNETNFGRVFLVKYIMHQIFDVWNFIVTIKACVHSFYFFFHQNKNFKQLWKMFFILPKKLLLSSKFPDYCTPLFFPFLAITVFIEKVDLW